MATAIFENRCKQERTDGTQKSAASNAPLLPASLGDRRIIIEYGNSYPVDE
jgi:hypothetical protein